MDVLSSRVVGIKPSPTMAVSARAMALRVAGKRIINFAAGEPDFDTPDHVKQVAIEAIQQGKTKYTPVDGIPELKVAIQAKLKRENNLSYEDNQIIVSCGAKHSLYNLCQAILNDSDEVIVPAPYWVSYPDMISLTGAKPVIIKAGLDSNFKMTQQQLDAAISSKTRMLILNSPSNPSGSVYSESELKALADVLQMHSQIIVVTDDIYEHILWEGAFKNILNVSPDLYERTVVVNGVSKAYSMTGWRIGYAAGPASIIKAMSKIQSQSTSNPTSISQFASVAALNSSQEFVRQSCTAFQRRHDYVFGILSQIKGVACAKSAGTFYLFPSMSRLIEYLPDITDDIALATFFLEDSGVALVPGSAFGMPGFMRFSYALSMADLEEGMQLIQKTIERTIYG